MAHKDSHITYDQITDHKEYYQIQCNPRYELGRFDRRGWRDVQPVECPTEFVLGCALKFEEAKVEMQKLQDQNPNYYFRIIHVIVKKKSEYRKFHIDMITGQKVYEEK